MPRPFNPPPMSRLALEREVQACFKRISFEEDRPREPEPIVWQEQCAARLSLTLGVLRSAIARGELPAPPKHRRDGDRYHRVLERGWAQLPPERRAALQAISERDYTSAVDEEEPQARPRGGLSKKNTSGFRGVSRCGKKWIAQIFVDGAIQRIGRFDRIEDAAAAYQEALAEKRARKS